MLAVTTQRYRHERGFVFTVGALYVANFAAVPENSSISFHSSPVALSCHRYDSVSSVSTPSKFVIAVYTMFPGVPATASPQRGVTDTVASALGSSSVVNVSA